MFVYCTECLGGAEPRHLQEHALIHLPHRKREFRQQTSVYPSEKRHSFVGALALLDEKVVLHLRTAHGRMKATRTHGGHLCERAFNEINDMHVPASRSHGRETHLLFVEATVHNTAREIMYFFPLHDDVHHEFHEFAADAMSTRDPLDIPHAKRTHLTLDVSLEQFALQDARIPSFNHFSMV
ncbi:hypothetical protein PsorP6_011300 [Peronosclerospora sorghi]|uniref:Uncharacterized protein n=1 Tax=Peronosclerospora sorghi TaxID=230839 RepID=A0ACC0WL14_9STRA|nr:hypothetical protein PsorP6_011300 [Peronosclerospora sorghi]